MPIDDNRNCRLRAAHGRGARRRDVSHASRCGGRSNRRRANTGVVPPRKLPPLTRVRKRRRSAQTGVITVTYKVS